MVAEESYYAVLLILCLIIGMCIGSFMNVVIYRLPLMLYRENDVRGISLSWPPSHCPACHSQIKWYDNIPLLSWLRLGGKCRHCQSAISACYPLTEALTGLWFVAMFVCMGGPLSTLLQFSTLLHVLPPLVLFCLLYCITLIDFRHYLIPDSLSVGLLWLGMIFSVADIIPVSPLQSVAGCVLAFVIIGAVQKGYYLLRKHEGLGGGDTKLFAAAAVWLGLNQLPQLILFSALCGAVLYAIQAFYQHRVQRIALQKPLDADASLAGGHFYIPFGPAIALVTLIMFLCRI